MIRVGLVGFGLAGRVFHAPLISSVEGFELAAVVERNSDKASARYPGITTYRTLSEMLADSSIKLVVVATPNDTHCAMAMQALEAARNVVVDKPVGISSAEVAQMMELADGLGLLLVPFHSRRFDSDFQTIQKLLLEGILGHLVHFDSCLDRWRPGATRRPWKDEPAQGGGVLLDLGTHLVDQALTQFGLPESVSAEVLREREGEGANDSFTVRLHYFTGFAVTLSSNNLSSLPRPRFHLRGTKGNFVKSGVDPQEEALDKITRITDPHWGQEPSAAWGTLCVDVDGGMVTRPVEPVPGDYRLFYAGVRDAILRTAPTPVESVAAWRVARVLEWAIESAEKRRDIECDWSDEPV